MELYADIYVYQAELNLIIHFERVQTIIYLNSNQSRLLNYSFRVISNSGNYRFSNETPTKTQNLVSGCAIFCVNVGDVENEMYEPVSIDLESKEIFLNF